MAGYGDDNGFNAWLTENGYTLPAGAPAPAVLRQRGSTYVDGLYGSQFSERRFSGAPTGGFAQERAFPRTGAKAYNTDIPADVTPVAVINASYFAAWYEGNNDGALAATVVAAAQIKSEQIGKLKTDYFEGSGNALADATPMLLAVEGLLAPFLIPDVPTVATSIWSIG